MVYDHQCLTAKHIRHAELYLDSPIDILSKLVSDEYSSKLSRMLKREEETKKVSMYDGIVNVTDIALYSKTKYDATMDETILNNDLVGLYIRIEQNKPDRRSTFDRAAAEIFIMNNSFLYIVTSADDNRYNVDSPDERYYNIYKNYCIEIGLKPIETEKKGYFDNNKPEYKAYRIELKPYEEEFEYQLKLKKIGIFNRSQKRDLQDILINKYRVYGDKYKWYMDKMRIVLKEEIAKKAAQKEKEKQKVLIK